MSLQIKGERMESETGMERNREEMGGEGKKRKGNGKKRGWEGSKRK